MLKSLLCAQMLICSATATFATEWNVSLWGQRRAFTEHVERLAELVAKDSGGTFTINLVYGGLAPNRENLDGIAAGSFEMAQFCAGYHAEKNRAITVLELPFLGVANLEEELAVSLAVYQHPSVVAEMEKWNAKLLMPTPLPQQNIVGTGDAPAGLDWFDGKSLRATGGIGAALRAVGAQTESLTAPETFGAMEGGLIEAVAFSPHAHFSFKTIDLAEWWTSNLNPGVVNCPVVVNTDAYEALSPEHRAILDGAVEPALDYYLAYYNDLLHKWTAILEIFNVEYVELPQSDMDRFRELVAVPVRDDWILTANSEGLPGEELVQLVDRTLDGLRNGVSN